MTMEIWDGYRSDGTPAHVELIRAEPVPEGLYHLVCEIIVEHQDGSILPCGGIPASPTIPVRGRQRRRLRTQGRGCTALRHPGAV